MIKANERQKGALSWKQLAKMTLPLMLEGVLCITVGFADTLMVSGLGENAVSAVSTVDSLNVLLNELLLAIAMGGTVVISQHLGKQQHKEASDAARQGVYINVLLALSVMLALFFGGKALLSALFPALHAEVFGGAVIYLRIVCFSYPFLALFHCGSGIFRAQGQFKASMLISVFMNIINILANAFFIYGLKMGVAGAAAGTVTARIFSAGAILLLLNKSSHTVRLDHLTKVAFHRVEVARILRVGVPCGLENTLFHIGKILLQSVIVLLGTSALAANAVANNLAGLSTVPANAFCIVALTLVGNCAGAQNFTLAQNHIKRLALFCETSLIIFNIALFFTAHFWAALFNLSPQITQTATELIRVYSLGSILLWMPSFLFPSALRAAGDAKFTMTVAFLSMWICRIGLSYVLVLHFKMGLQGIWLCMLADWGVRAIFFSVRIAGSKWKQKALV